jgi:hypothetical protein
VPWFLHGLCVAPRLPPMGPVNLGTCNIKPKSTVLTTIFGAIVATGAFGSNGEASSAGSAGSALLLVLLSSASSAAWVISWIECELLGGGRGGMMFVFKFQNQFSEVELKILKI